MLSPGQPRVAGIWGHFPLRSGTLFFPSLSHWPPGPLDGARGGEDGGSGLSRGREHCSRPGGSWTPCSNAPPHPLPAPDVAQPDPSCRRQSRRGRQLFLQGAHGGADQPWTWCGALDQGSQAGLGEKGGATTPGIFRLVLRAPPECWQAPAAGLAGGQDRGNTVTASVHDSPMKRAQHFLGRAWHWGLVNGLELVNIKG